MTEQDMKKLEQDAIDEARQILTSKGFNLSGLVGKTSTAQIGDKLIFGVYFDRS